MDNLEYSFIHNMKASLDQISIRLSRLESSSDYAKEKTKILELIGAVRDSVEKKSNSITCSKETFKSGLLGAACKLVLIDDDTFFANEWIERGHSKGISVFHYSCGEDFLGEVYNFEKSTPIFIDWFLSGAHGSTELIKQISDLGFTEIHITTSVPNLIPKLREVKSVQGKEPLY